MFKWIETSPGRYKTVPLSDPRPTKTPPKKELGRGPFVISAVPWAAMESAMHDGTNHDKQRAATDAFIDERSKWTATSTKYRKWEQGRKAEWAKNKPTWRKKMMKEGRV